MYAQDTDPAYAVVSKGEEAYKAGKPFESNPYKKPYFRRCWASGFDTVRKDAEEEARINASFDPYLEKVR